VYREKQKRGRGQEEEKGKNLLFFPFSSSSKQIEN
jgi:hypothetical protein